MAKRPAKAKAGDPPERRAPAQPSVPAPPPPVPLGSILGQARALETLRAAIRSQRIHHAWIFHGPAGVGKFTAALSFAAVLLDPSSAPTLAGEIAPDRESPVQRLLAAGTHPDLHVITKELALFSGDAEVRKRKLITIPKAVIDEHLLGPAALGPSMPTSARATKVFIVDEAEMLDASPTNAPSQNAILKTLEEPPEGTVIILVTSSEEQLLPTIRSRSQRVPFTPLSDPDMLAWLKRSGLDLPPVERDWLLEFSAGSPGALTLAHRGGLHAWHVRLAPLLDALDRGKYSIETAPAMAQLIDEWAVRWVEEHENASKELANRLAAEWMFRLLAERARGRLRAAAGAGDSVASARVVGALDALRRCEARLDANVNAIFALEGWVADVTAINAGEGALA